MAIPKKDALLVPYSTNFDSLINADPTIYGLTSEQAIMYTPLHDAYVTAYNAMMEARANGTRSETQTAAKDTAKDTLLTYARELYLIVSASNSVSDANKIALGVHVRSGGNSPVPAPSTRPGVELVSVVARTVTVDIYGTASGTSRAKPSGVVGAKVYTFVGSEYPSDPSAWAYQGDATKQKFEIAFPDSVENGAQVWICAAWYNRKAETGPVSMPITTHLQYGGVQASTDLKMAA